MILSHRIAAALVAALLPTGASAQVLELEHQKLIGSDTEAFDNFGQSVAVEDDLMVVGTLPSDTDLGAAYVFEHRGGVWVEVQKLTASGGQANDRFGQAVDLSQGRIVVGAPSDDRGGLNEGSVHVFESIEGSWTEVQRLQSTSGGTSEFFGYSLALDGGRLAVGAPFTPRSGTSRSGAVHVFERGESDWQETQSLNAGDDLSDDFGWSVGLDGEFLVAGAPKGSRGAAFVYRLQDGFWVEHQLDSGDHDADRSFGSSVAIEGDLVAVGDPKALVDLGRISLFRWDGTEWIGSALLEGPRSGGSSEFGSSLALCGRTLATGAPEYKFVDGPRESGAVLSYRFDGSRWVSLRTMRVSDPIEAHYLGSAIALDQDTLVAGVARDEQRGQDAGAAYTFPHGALAMNITPTDLQAGDSVRLKSCGGLYGGFVVLYVQSVDGEPFRRWLTAGRFRGDGEWNLQNTVPPGLEGIDLSLSTIGFVAPDEIAESNLQTIRLR